MRRMISLLWIPAAFAALSVAGRADSPAPAPMELTFGINTGAGIKLETSEKLVSQFKPLGVTSVEMYVPWSSVEPDAQGKWDWSDWDARVAMLEKEHLKWVPFLMAGPAYATPLWFQKSPDSHYFKCLEHGEESRLQSIFNPAMRPQVDRFLAAVAERYSKRGVIESVLLGVSGIFGESLYPAGKADGGWTARLTGPFHNHGGWWAGDDYAIASFRGAMVSKYVDIANLNAAWKTKFASFAKVAPFLPDVAPGDGARTAPSDNARADFVEWYEQSMTDWCVVWAETARRHFPNTEIYLCVGGKGTPMSGADFTAQAKAVAPYRVGIRITNEGNDYAANFAKTREAATAAALYGTFFGFEPATKLGDRAMGARIYNATASGANQMHCYYHNVLQSDASLACFKANVPFLKRRQPSVDVAFYLSRETWALDSKATDRSLAIAERLRDLVDFSMVTRQSTLDDALRDHRALILVESAALDPSAAAAIEKWTRAGGVTIVATRANETVAFRLNDLRAWRGQMFGDTAPTVAPTVTPAAPRAHNRKAAAAKRPSLTIAPPHITRVGAGWTVCFRGGADDPEALVQALEPLMRETGKTLTGVAPLAPIDGHLDRRYATRFTDGSTLWFNATTASIEKP